jgi:serine/threonine protein phosphatase 1
MKILKLEMEEYENIWVTSDIHGYQEVFLKLLEKMNLTPKDLLIIDGDSCDRGAKSFEMYETVGKLLEDGLNIIHIRGNHEELMINGVENEDYSLWYMNGGWETMKSYNEDMEKLKEHLKYIKKMPIAVDLGKYFIVHGGIDPNISIEEQEERDMIWIRDEFINSPLVKTDKIIVYGHTPNLDGKIHFVDDQKISIDTGSYETGVVGAIELKSLKTIYESTDKINKYF